MDFPPVMRLTLTGQDNRSYIGTLYLRNANGVDVPVDNADNLSAGSAHYKPLPHPVFGRGSEHSSRDPNGATYYVVAVVLVYGFSIVLLIASHIKRKNAKALQDRQINKYLQEFQVVRETSSRDRYKKLKRDITAKLTYERVTVPTTSGGITSYRVALTKAALLPLTAVALPTIRESGVAAKRTLSDMPTSRSTSLVGPSAPACYRACRSASVRPMLRPCVAALPMRSWNSDDTNSLAAGNDAACNRRVLKRARLCRTARVDDTSSLVIATPNIPIIISSPDDHHSQLVTEDTSTAELSSAYRRSSSCPFSVCDVILTDHDDAPTSSATRLTSRKRKHTASQRRPSLQLTSSTARCHLAVNHDLQRTSADNTTAEQRKDEETARTSPAARERVSGECYLSSVDVDWSTRRLSLPHSSTSAADDGCFSFTHLYRVP